jgi:aspartyl-tRNA(Asn)/glutamyl-tRNA(Gln) amidotransferase subunit A
VALGTSYFAITTDTIDSTRRPASFAGVVGYKPSYGLISRYGIYCFSQSLDTISIIAKYVTDVTLVASEVIKKNKKDFSNHELKQKIQLPRKIENLTLSKIENIENYFYNDDVKNIYLETVRKLEGKGIKFINKKLDINLMKMCTPTYIALCYSEAFTNRSAETGVQIKLYENEGSYEQILEKNREKMF